MTKNLLRKKLGCIPHTFEHTENSLEHWITFTYIIDSEVVKEETKVCIVHKYEYSKLPDFFIKNIIF